MANMLALIGDRSFGGILKDVGEKALHGLGKVAKHPLTKPLVYGGIAYVLGKEVMKNDYSATADLGFASFSLTKNSTTKR